MIETLYGVIFGGIISWIIAHLYYRKQEKTSPVELIKGMNEKIKELYNLAVDRKDKELQRKIKNLKNYINSAHHKIIMSVLPLDIDIQGLYEVYKSGDKKRFTQYLNEALPNLFKFHERVVEITQTLAKLKKITWDVAESENNQIIDGV